MRQARGSILAMLVATVLVPASIVGQAYGETFGWHPSSPLYVGATYDPDNLKEPKVPCLKDTSVVPIDTGAPSTSFKSSILSSKKELFQIFSISASFSASYGVTTVDASVSSLSEVNFDSETIVWSLTASSNYGRTALTNVELKDSYAAMSPDVVRGICGTHVIVMDRREAVASAIFTFRSTSRKTRDELKASLTANWSGGSLSADMTNQLKQALKNTEVSFTFLAKGGDGLAGTSGFVTTFDKIDEIRQQVANYVAKQIREKAPAAEYTGTRLPLFSDVKVVLDARERTLSAVWYDYLTNDQVLREAKTKLEKLDSYWYLSREPLKQYLLDISNRATSKIEQLSKAVESCLADKAQCNYKPEPYSEPIDWPSVELVYKSGTASCTKNGDSCEASVDFLLRIRGPGRPNSIARDKIQMEFPGTDLTTTCLEGPPWKDPEGQTYRCGMGFNMHTVKLEKLDVVVKEKNSGAVAIRTRFADAFPDHWFYTRPEWLRP